MKSKTNYRSCGTSKVATRDAVDWIWRWSKDFWLHPWKLPTEVLALWIPSWGKVQDQELWWNFAWVYQLLWLIWKCGLIPTDLGNILLQNHCEICSMKDTDYFGCEKCFDYSDWTWCREIGLLLTENWFCLYHNRKLILSISRQKTDCVYYHDRKLILSLITTENWFVLSTTCVGCSA